MNSELIKTCFTLADLGHLGLFTRNLQYLLTRGSASYPYPIPDNGIELVGEKEMWKLLELEGETPSLRHWRNLGLPASKSINGYSYDSDTVQPWLWKISKLTTNMIFIVPKKLDDNLRDDDMDPAFKYKLKKMVGVYTEVGLRKYEIYSDCSYSPVFITDYGKYFSVDGNIAEYLSPLEPRKRSFYRNKDWIYWNYCNPVNVKSFCREISELLNVKASAILSAEGYMNKNGKGALGGMKGLFDPSVIEPFNTYEPFVSGGFEGLIVPKTLPFGKRAYNRSWQKKR